MTQPGVPTGGLPGIAAITDLLPGPVATLLALWLWLRFLRRGGVAWHVGGLAAFTACLLTHESSATLLPMLIALEVTVRAGSGAGSTWPGPAIASSVLPAVRGPARRLAHHHPTSSTAAAT